MSEETNPEARPRISVTPLLEALEYDADFHLHRGQPAEQAATVYAESIPASPRVLPWQDYLQALGRRMSIAGAGLGLFMLAGVLLMGGIYCFGRDIDMYLDSQPRPIHVAATIQIPPKKLTQVGNLPLPDNDLSQEEPMTQGKPLPVNWLQMCMFHLLFFPLAIYGCTRTAYTCIQKAEETEVGVPLTAANTGHLPAAESLMRASEKSVQDMPNALLRPSRAQSPSEQMLRPAAYTMEQQPEQLVRPTAGQE